MRHRQWCVIAALALAALAAPLAAQSSPLTGGAPSPAVPPDTAAPTRAPAPDSSEVTHLVIVTTRPRAQAFAAAMTVLADSGFTPAAASADAGFIRTEWRDPARAHTHGLGNLIRRTYGAFDIVRLSVLVLPAGADSTRVTLTGEWRFRDTDPKAIRSGERHGWTTMAGVAAAIRQALGH